MSPHMDEDEDDITFQDEKVEQASRLAREVPDETVAWVREVAAPPGTREAVHEPPGLMGRWLVYWHGRGGHHQHDYYRCHGCLRIVTWKAIWRGGCTCKLSSKLSPAALRWWEKGRLLVLPWWCVR